MILNDLSLTRSSRSRRCTRVFRNFCVYRSPTSKLLLYHLKLTRILIKPCLIQNNVIKLRNTAVCRFLNSARSKILEFNKKSTRRASTSSIFVRNVGEFNESIISFKRITILLQNYLNASNLIFHVWFLITICMRYI